MKPSDLAKCGTEHGHQAALFCWASQQKQWSELLWLYAIPNGGERNIAVAGRLKAEGVKSGISDLCLPVARRGYFGFYMEMKRPASAGKPAGTESKTQKEFGAFLATQGYFYCCCNNWEDAARTIAWYFGVEDGSF
jgi:hypothetical protein